MPGVSYSVDDAAALAAIGNAQRVADRPRGLMSAIGAYFVFSSQRNIENETAPDGTKWPALSPRTAAHRVGRGRRGYDHMLRVTARLFQSLAYDATDDSVEWGSNVEYARIHQLGGTIDMPAREGRVSLKAIRRKGGGVRSRFVKPGAKGALERAVSIGAHQVRIPARPYLGVSAADQVAVQDISADYLRSEVGS